MGFADAVTGRLYLARKKSDLEFKLQVITERKMAVLDASNQVSAGLANTIFQSGGMHESISDGAALPGFIGGSPLIPPMYIPQLPIGVNLYEFLLGYLQNIEKELDAKQKKFETELEAVKTEEESVKKIASDHAKKDFKMG